MGVAKKLTESYKESVEEYSIEGDNFADILHEFSDTEFTDDDLRRSAEQHRLVKGLFDAYVARGYGNR